MPECVCEERQTLKDGRNCHVSIALRLRVHARMNEYGHVIKKLICSDHDDISDDLCVSGETVLCMHGRHKTKTARCSVFFLRPVTLRLLFVSSPERSRPLEKSSH